VNARHVALTALLAVALMVSGCSGSPEPVGTTQGFATEEEAFAAAEETYRAYVDALNQVDLSDPATFEPVFALTTGDANANTRQTLSEMHANGWTVVGNSLPATVEPVDYVRPAVTLAVCLDVSDVEVVDAGGESVVADDRGDVQSVLVTIEASEQSPQMTVDQIDARSGEPLCEP
jgi:hypothetical protein